MIELKAYNLKIKYAGNNITIKDYVTNTNIKGYISKCRNRGKKGQSEQLEENFNKSSLRATQNIFDIVSCNLDKHYIFGTTEKAYLKFLTLTFKENINDFDKANYEFTKFNKRLSYKLHGVRKNVLKYIVVPELQQRGAIHYHIIYFNLPFIPFKDFLEVWANGGAFIEAVSEKQNASDGSQIQNIAKYVSKYVSKTMKENGESNSFEVWKEKGMLNKKRYFTSRGLHKPLVQDYSFTKDAKAFLYSVIEEEKTKCNIYENDYRGIVAITNLSSNNELTAEIKQFSEVVNEYQLISQGFKKDYKEVYKRSEAEATKIMTNKYLNLEIESKEYYSKLAHKVIQKKYNITPEDKVLKYNEAFKRIKEKKAQLLLKTE